MIGDVPNNAPITIHPCSNCGGYDEVHEHLIKKRGSAKYPGLTEMYIHSCLADNLHYYNGDSFIYLCESCSKYFDKVATDHFEGQSNMDSKNILNAYNSTSETTPKIDIDKILAPEDETNGDTFRSMTDQYPVEIESTCQKCRTNNPKANILCRDLDIDFFGVKHVDLCDRCYKQIKQDIKESKETYFFKRLPNCKTSALAAALSNALYTHHHYGSDYDPELFILDEDENLPGTCLYNPMNIKVVMKDRHGDHTKRAVYLIPYKSEE